MPFGPFALQWRRPIPNPPSPTPLPEGVIRSSIHTPSGPLELLTALPSTSTNDAKPPLFFAHGGFGCAEMWLSYMQYFAARGYPCYAMSYRGHGKSWYPSFWRMYFTTRHAVAEDLAAGIEYVQALETARRGGTNGKEDTTRVVLVAHSAGGALSQYALSRKMISVRGFCMFAAVPGFGSWSCYKFWAAIAPIHYPYRAFHPRYILATIPQIHEAFFTAETPVSLVQRFAPLLAPFESMLWPVQALFRFVTGPDVLSSITGWGIRLPNTSKSPGDEDFTLKQGLFVLAAEKDVLCTPAVLGDAAQRYRQALEALLSEGEDVQRERVTETAPEGGVRFRVVKGLAHHLQNHEEWEKGADEVRQWLEQL